MRTDHYRFLLVDADDTVFDFHAAERAAFCEMAVRLSLPELVGQYEVYHEINKRCWKMLERGETDMRALRSLRFRMLLDEVPLSSPAEPDEMLSVYETLLGEQMFLLPGAERALSVLSDAYRLLLITNGFSGVQRRRLALTGVERFFSGVYISEELGVRKPEKAFFDRVLAEEAIRTRRECLVVGDSLSSDVAGGNRAGLDVCWINPRGKPLPPNYSVKFQVPSLEALVPLLMTPERGIGS